jgi:hypothetical protein
MCAFCNLLVIAICAGSLLASERKGRQMSPARKHHRDIVPTLTATLTTIAFDDSSLQRFEAGT